VVHVELPLSDAAIPAVRPGQQAQPGRPVLAGTLAGWADVVAAAPEPCLLIDAGATVLACSGPASVLFGLASPAHAVGRGLLDGVLRLVDFTAAGGLLADWELARIPPLLVLSTGGLARGLMRLRLDDAVRTVDAVATPLRDGAEVTGSLTFLSRI
jgi:hypothetical protein